jgi:hypothetical protein
MPGDLDVDPEQRLAGHDLRVVDAGERLADELVVLDVLERDLGQVGRGQGRRLGGQLAVFQRAARRLVAHGALTASHSASGTPQVRGRGLDEQHAPAAPTGAGCPSSSGCACCRPRIAGRTSLFAVRLLDLDVLPVDAELLGDDLLQRGLDALAALGFLETM